jgi:metal-responsive CopG/Arc/MetJ family transcriptional regulator
MAKVPVKMTIDADVLEALDNYAETEYFGNRSMAATKIIQQFLEAKQSRKEEK